MRTFYEVLGVSPDADQQTIRRAYLEKAKVLHPDAKARRGLPADSGDFVELDTAYKTLRDPTLRALYDVQLQAEPRAAARPPPQRGADLWDRLEVPLPLAVRGGSIRAAGVELTIPPGTMSGDRMRLRGRGGPGRPRGDLMLEVEVSPHPVWRLAGLDLHVALPVTWLEAYRGGIVRLRTPWRVVHLPLEPGTRDGLVFEVEGDGVRRDDQRGTLFAVVQLQPPPPGDLALSGVLLRLQGLQNPREAMEADFA